MVQTIDGHVPNYVNPQTRVPEYLGVQISLTAFTLIIVLLRLYTRRFLRNVFSLEDWVAAFSMLLALVSTIISCLSALGGTGLHYYDIPPSTNKRLAASFSFAAQVLYQPILNTTKISICLFYMSSLGRGVQRPCQVLIALAIAFCIACTVVEFT
ncbi:hypothetical protein AOQ84DRAFT_202122 [Glonium stellatum]|uniref:Rhodopsin domain-containing protein n=1 Tax=Glonium stellatum TaxID=574774 RepID=A0A8E2F606_9PEZI|nr:hypothetical protein AOQ84DRAFT_202122 [Glonium stellatum]